MAEQAFSYATQRVMLLKVLVVVVVAPWEKKEVFIKSQTNAGGHGHLKS
jgi:hypothetical protein